MLAGSARLKAGGIGTVGPLVAPPLKQAQASVKPKCQTWEETKEKILNITATDLWSLQKILHNKRGSPSQTYTKNTEANAEVYDLNQKTMQALESLAVVYAGEQGRGND